MKMTLVILLSAVLLAVTVSAAPATVSSDGRLRIIDIGENTLEAIFYNAETGIRIRADSVSLTLISMRNDQVLLSGTKPHGSSMLASIMGASFLVYNTTRETGENRKIEFVVPESLVDQTKNALAAAKEERMISQLDQDETETRTATRSAFHRLFEQPEIALLESAARALGNAGIMGYENQGALNFYAVARALLKSGREEEEGEGSGDVEEQHEDDSTGRSKRQWWWGNTVYCENVNRNCRRCPEGNECVGLCGRLCDCWWWFCLTCCYQHGCYGHDRCCDRHGMDSIQCQMPMDFNCDYFPCFS